jgi:hypothetical protein
MLRGKKLIIIGCQIAPHPSQIKKKGPLVDTTWANHPWCLLIHFLKGCNNLRDEGRQWMNDSWLGLANFTHSLFSILWWYYLYISPLWFSRELNSLFTITGPCCSTLLMYKTRILDVTTYLLRLFHKWQTLETILKIESTKWCDVEQVCKMQDLAPKLVTLVDKYI